MGAFSWFMLSLRNQGKIVPCPQSWVLYVGISACLSCVTIYVWLTLPIEPDIPPCISILVDWSSTVQRALLHRWGCVSDWVGKSPPIVAFINWACITIMLSSTALQCWPWISCTNILGRSHPPSLSWRESSLGRRDDIKFASTSAWMLSPQFLTCSWTNSWFPTSFLSWERWTWMYLCIESMKFT